MIDFHTHILPGIDDGSKDLKSSINMVNRCAEQGVEWIVATPHFYAHRDSIDRFLRRRQKAFELLEAELPKGSPKILAGAEVAYFPGISRAGRLEELTVEGTDIFLLEMPFSVWTRSEMKELEWLAESAEFRILLAHLERYLLIPENRKEIERILELPLTIQINAGSVLDWRRRGKVIKLLQKGRECVLGSDCHGMHHRPPNLLEGRAVIEKKLGTDFLNRIDKTGSALLQNTRRD